MRSMLVSRAVAVGIRVVISLSLTAGIAVSDARAQAPVCTVTPTGAGNAADICRKAADLFAFVVPQVGIALSGGNHILGEGGTLGGWSKRSVTLRFSAVDGRVPRNTIPLTLSRPGAATDDFGAVRTFVPMPSLDLAVGLLTGLPVGVTNVGGVDALVGVIGLSPITAKSFNAYAEGARVALSYGLRIGVLQESAFVPGIGVSWLRRTVPTINVDYTPTNDSIAMRDVSLSSNTLRLAVSKRIVLFGFAAGIGRDQIAGAANLRAIANETVGNVNQRASITFPTLREKVTRNTAFANVSFGVPIARVVVEYGRSSSATLRETLNRFGARQASDTYAYGSAGVTVRF